MRLTHDFAANPGRAWAVLHDAMKANLEVEAFATGTAIKTGDGATGTIEASTAHDLRFTWKEPAWGKPSHVLLHLAATPRGCILILEHKGLPDLAAHDWYEGFWKAEFARWDGLLPPRDS